VDKASPVGTPLYPNVMLEPNPDGNQGDRNTLYASLLGALQFEANTTRPKIAYNVNRLASYTANPNIQHVRVLKELCDTCQGLDHTG
jgi:hypothetical protein